MHSATKIVLDSTGLFLRRSTPHQRDQCGMSQPPSLQSTGPTKLADIANLSSPAHAPSTIRFSAAMTALFQSLWQQSFPGGKAKEQGGTIVADREGNFSLQFLGGRGSTADYIDYIIATIDPAKYTVVGTFHTHPYDNEPASFTGASFSGGDIGALLIDPLVIMQVLLSHSSLFVHLQTASSPTRVSQMTLHAAMDKQVALLTKNGMSFEAAAREGNRVASAAARIAYYEGANGVATKR